MDNSALGSGGRLNDFVALPDRNWITTQRTLARASRLLNYMLPMVMTK